MRTAFVGLGLGFLLSQAACPSESGSDCQPGTIGCECVQGTCDVGLQCSDDVCIGSGGPGTSGDSGETTPQTSSAGSDDGPATGDGDGSSDGAMTTAADDTAGDTGEDTGPASCEDMGGMVLPQGACLIECEHNPASKGGDLFEDCLPYGMLCDGNGVHGDWCEPSADCTTDADCGEGWKCVSPDGGGYCNVYCESDSDCPGMQECELTDEFDIYGAINHCAPPV